MIYGILFGLLVLDCIVLGAAILMQSGKGGGMAASFGGASSSSDALIGVRQAGNVLSAASWWAGGIFLFLAFVLSLMSSRSRAPRSVLDQPAAAVPVAPLRSPTPAAGAPASPLEQVPATGAPSTTPPAPRP